MAQNLLDRRWTEFDSQELRILLDKYFGGPGQYRDRANNSEKLYLPLADNSCRIEIEFGRDGNIEGIFPGVRFVSSDWDGTRREIESYLYNKQPKVGREYSFSSFRVKGFWLGNKSGVQILPPPHDAPQAPVEMADHPFVLESPIDGTDYWTLTNYRRQKMHRSLTRALNVLLAGRTSLQSPRSRHLWALVPQKDPPRNEVQWVQEFYFAPLGKAVVDEHSAPAGSRLEEIEPSEYYSTVGHDGRALCVPTDLDERLCDYSNLTGHNRAKLNRAFFWMDAASRQWDISVSSSFASLVSAVESLTEEGAKHGATEKFRAFFERYAPGASLKRRRTRMYAIRSGILHGSRLLHIDEGRDFGWDPPGWEERELHGELWSLARIGLRNWLIERSKAQ